MMYDVYFSKLCYGKARVEANSEDEAATIASGVEVDYFDEEITDTTVVGVKDDVLSKADFERLKAKGYLHPRIYAPKRPSEEDDRTYIVTELCPHCAAEVEMRWNTDMDGFKAFCPYCGKRLMLCDECIHTEDNRGCDYDSKTDTCYRNRTDAEKS